MIEVRDLSKRYGTIDAIADVGFRVGRGEVVGFLGPNGAGKTTTMRILCGCIGADTGRVTVNGLDVTEHPAKVKASIGYLPESPPLYTTMTVRAYVRFAATVKGVRDPDGATDRVLAMVGLDQEVGGRPAPERIIGHLSKGFQQRVGLAQALVHEPDVLVLDEPTSGLDPAQRKEIRELLLKLARDSSRTVVLSTHVLPEVEAMCDRVIVIDQGRIIAQDTLEGLRKDTGRLRVHLAQPGPEALAALEAVPGVVAVEAADDGTYTLSASTDVRAEVARAAVRHGLLELTQADTLEDIYLRLTSADGRGDG
jgi:ABC-2 type transport system ATP-binding protein